MTSKPPATSKYLVIQDAIHKKVVEGQWRPGEPIPSVRELSEKHHTSMLTARRAVESLVDRGMLVASQGVGTFVSNRPTFHRVGIVLGVGPGAGDREILGPRRFLRLTESGLHAWADQHMLNVCTYEYRSDNQVWNERSPLYKDVENKRVDGLILVGVPSQALAMELLQHHVPAVAIGNVPAALPYRVTLDTRAFMHAAIEVVRRDGRQRIGLIAGLADIDSGHAMVVQPSDHFASACLSHEVEVVSQRISLSKPNTAEAGYNAAHSLLSLEAEARPDALVVADDVLAEGVMRYLDELPQDMVADLSWVSHANFGGDAANHPSLIARLEYDPAEVTECAADMLAALMHNRPPQQCIRLIAPRLVPGK